MNNSKSALLGRMTSELLAAASTASPFIHRWHTMLRAGYVGALCLTIAAALVGGIETAQGAPGGIHGKQGGGGSIKTTGFTGVNLGALPGGNSSIAFSVSETGSVVGLSSFASDGTGTIDSPVYWHFNGQSWDIYSLLPAAPNGESGVAFGIAGPVNTVEYVVGTIGSTAMIWTVTGHTSFSNPEPLAKAADCDWSTAYGVNVHQVAVGHCDYGAAIWTPDGTGYKTTKVPFLSNPYTVATDVNDDGVVVGNGCDFLENNCHAFILKIGSDAIVPLTDSINGDPYSYVTAVSDVVVIDDTAFVYVTGSTKSAAGTETGTRWTVAIPDAGPLSDAVMQMTLTKQWCSGVNNAGDAVCTSSGGGRQSTVLIRDGAVNSLKPPRRATDAATYDLARTDTLPTYAVGNIQVNGFRAAVWVIDK